MGRDRSEWLLAELGRPGAGVLMANAEDRLLYVVVLRSYVFTYKRSRVCMWFGSSLLGVHFEKIMLVDERFIRQQN